MKNFLLKEKEHLGGTQRIYKFPNGFGASVVQSPFSYGGRVGLWELAMVEFIDDEKYELVYNDIVEGDVLGYLTESEVEEVLEKIKNFSF